MNQIEAVVPSNTLQLETSAKEKNTFPQSSRPVALLVPGMHRSGTSALSGTLNLLGVAIPGQLVPPSIDNPKGFFENERVVAFHDKLLEEFGSRWEDPLPLREKCLYSPNAYAAAQELAILFQEEFGNSPLVLVKDPRMCRLLPVWIEALSLTNRKIAVILPVRHPLEVAASLQRRGSFPRAHGLGLWLQHVLAAERSTRSLVRCFVIYDDLLHGWRSVVHKIGETLGLAWSKDSIRVEREIDQFLSSELRHHWSTEGISAAHDDALHDLCSRAWGALKLLSTDNRDWSAEATLDQVAQEYDGAMRILSPLLASLDGDLVQSHRRLVDCDARIDNLTAAMTERDERIDSLTAAMAERDGRIDGLNSALAERNGQIDGLNSALAERNGQIDGLNSALAERDGRIDNLTPAFDLLHRKHVDQTEKLASLQLQRDELARRGEQVAAELANVSQERGMFAHRLQLSTRKLAELEHEGAELRRVNSELLSLDRSGDAVDEQAILRFSVWMARKRVLFGLARRVAAGRQAEARSLIEQSLRANGISDATATIIDWLSTPRVILGLGRRGLLAGTDAVQGLIAIEIQRRIGGHGLLRVPGIPEVHHSQDLTQRFQALEQRFQSLEAAKLADEKALLAAQIANAKLLGPIMSADDGGGDRRALVVEPSR